MRTLITATALCLGICASLSAAGALKDNPFLDDWKTPFGAPPFQQIKEEHYLPAFQEGMARQRKEVDAIAGNPAAPDFKNTIEALDASGQFLGRVKNVFFNLSSAETNDKLQAIRKEVTPMLAKHDDDIRLNAVLFKRVQAVWEGRAKAKLNAAQGQLLDYTYKTFVRSGALLTPEQQGRMRAINQELSSLAVQFTDNVLKETNAYQLVIERKEQLAGLPDAIVAAAADAAKRAGKEGKWVFTLQQPSIMGFLRHAENRDLRRQILTAYLSRADRGDAFDNKAIIARIAALRVEKAKLMGYETWADFVLEMNMAKNAKAVFGLLDQLWEPALAVAKREATELQATIDAEKGGFKLEAWDWRYYADKVKKAKYDIDTEALRAYFPLDAVRDGAFAVATKLYGLTFVERKDVPTYHEEVRVFEVRDKDGSSLGLLLTDYHPRPGKRGGAWCSAYRPAWIKDGKRVDPIIVNVGNFSRPTGDRPALLNLEEVKTLFHEFGHALHALMYTGPYRTGNMPRDFVELPSQIMENWSIEPEVLKTYAKHYRTGQVIPAALIDKVVKARRFNQGFDTVEYLAATKLDMEWHTLKDAKAVDAAAFEKGALSRMGLIPEIPVRYRSPYFNHIVGGYDAGYYGYIWSGVLDTDAFEAFKEKGNLFDPGTAQSFRNNVLEPGVGRDPSDMYRAFRGRDPIVQPLLKKRGLI